MPRYQLGAKVATRLAFGQALAAVGARSNVVVLDGEVGNSTHTEEFAKVYPERYFEMFIAEQQLVAAAVGMSVRKYVPFGATFAAFFSRAYDFVRMAAISQANIRLCGSHAGVEIGADGPSQMGLEDIAMMRAVHGSTVLYPSDATSAAYLVQEMADRAGVVYMRTTRGAYPVLYPPEDAFPIGGSKVVRSSQDDQVTLIGAGVTLHNCLDAAEQLGRDGIRARVVDLYSVKPIDTATLLGRFRGHERPPGRRRGPLPRGRYRQRRARGPQATRVTQFVSSTWRSATYPDPGRPKSSWRRRGSPPAAWSRPSVSFWGADKGTLSNGL